MAETAAVLNVTSQQARHAVAATNLISTGTWTDSAGSYHTIYPDGYTWYPQYHYPWPAPLGHTHLHVNVPVAEKPHEIVQRAITEIAQAARELARSAEQMGVPVEKHVLDEALLAKLRDAL